MGWRCAHTWGGDGQAGGRIRGGLTSPITTEGTIDSISPLLDQAVTSLHIADSAERAGDLDRVSATTPSYVGNFTIIDIDGDEIHATDTGIFNTATGAFASVTEIDGGTGKYSGATGALFPSGTVDFSTGTFAALFTGELCPTDDETYTGRGQITP